MEQELKGMDSAHISVLRRYKCQCYVSASLGQNRACRDKIRLSDKKNQIRPEILSFALVFFLHNIFKKIESFSFYLVIFILK